MYLAQQYFHGHLLTLKAAVFVQQGYQTESREYFFPLNRHPAGVQPFEEYYQDIEKTVLYKALLYNLY